MKIPARMGYGLKTAGWSLLFIALLEVFIRSLVYKTPLMQLHPDLGLVPRPGSSYVWGTEGFGVTHFLEAGEIVTPHTEGISVVILGDSFTEALQVGDAWKFPSVAESILWDGGLQVDLHNLGASGRNMADYTAMASFIVWKYSPEIVVLQVSREDFIESLDTSRPNYFTSGAPGFELVEQEIDYSLTLQNLVRRSGLLSFGVHQLGPVADDLIAEYILKAGPAKQRTRTLQAQAVAGEDYLGQQITALVEAYSGCAVVLLVVPNAPRIVDGSVSFDATADQEFVLDAGSYGLVTVLFPLQQFTELYRSEYILPRGFLNSSPGTGHLNREGHHILGQFLADFLEGVLP